VSRPPLNVPLDKDLYEHHFGLLAHYQKHSSELLRISLIGLAATGIMLGFAPADAQSPFAAALLHDPARLTVVAAIICFALAAAFALRHRYYSTDSMASLLDALRYAQHRSKISASETKSYKEEEDKVRAELHVDFHRSDRCLKCSASLLFVATLGLGCAFIFALFATA
jgi:hypothetical protein